MTKRKGDDEPLWVLLDGNGTVQPIKKDRHEDHDNVEFAENDDDDGDDDGDVMGTLNDDDHESVHHEVYIDQSQLVEEHEHDEINEEGVQASDSVANDSVAESTSITVKEEPFESSGPVVKWTDKATFRLLDLVEAVIAKESEVPGRSDRVWMRIAQDMKPFFYTAEDCHRKFKYMTRTYRSALDRRANNIPYKWRYFNRMCAILQNKIRSKRTAVSSVKTVQLSASSINSEPSTSALDQDPEEEVSMSKFDLLLKNKKQMLLEVKHQGEILQTHIEDCIASALRREQRENEMVKLLMDLKNQEQKKLDLFRKLLDKLWMKHGMKDYDFHRASQSLMPIDTLG